MSDQPNKVLVDASELERLRLDAARYQAVRKMDVNEFRLVWVAVLRGHHTFDELIDYRIVAYPRVFQDNGGFPPVATGNENPKKPQ